MHPVMVRRGKLERLATFVSLDQIVDGGDQPCDFVHRGQGGGASGALSAGVGDVCAAGVGVDGVGWSRRGWALMLISNVVDMMRGPKSSSPTLGSMSSEGGGHSQVLSLRRSEQQPP
jgi:hypothetical protein